jgi:glycerol-3-phosphate dehydrogenase
VSEARADALDRLAGGECDVLVVGGGIVGSRVAYEAARSGLRVVLVDAGDFGGATSSATSKFVHGGLRYMTSWQLRLVRIAQREREALCRIAPHLVRRQPMLLAERAGYSLPAYAAGLVLYKGISGAGTPWPRIISVRQARALAPSLRADGLRTCTLLPEAQTNDARLTLATVRAAAAAGATVLSYARVVELGLGSGRPACVLVDAGGEGVVEVRAQAVVNATGPWVDQLRSLEDATCAPLVRLSRGTHVVLPLDDGWSTGLASSRDGSRTTFAVPYQGMLLLGVTDTAHDGAPDEVRPTRGDVDALFEDASRFVAPELFDHARIRHAFAGLRVLPLSEGDTGRLPREHLISTGRHGMVSVAGGKLTTHRLIAVDALRRLPAEIRPRRLRVSDEPLPGARQVRENSFLRALDAEVRGHLLGLYGSDVETLLTVGEEDPSALERIHPGGPDVWAQVRFAVEHEWALTLEDVVHRRTTLALRGLDAPETLARVEAALRSRASTVPSAGVSVSSTKET